MCEAVTRFDRTSVIVCLVVRLFVCLFVCLSFIAAIDNDNQSIKE